MKCKICNKEFELKKENKYFSDRENSSFRSLYKTTKSV